MKVMTVVGTRPEIIKLSRVIARLDEVADHVLVHTGQNFDHGLSQIFFDELGVRAPDHFLEVGGASLAETIGSVIVRSDDVFAAHRPDALLVLGDTNSTLCVIPAKRRHIPIFHMEAGNRCFDERVPEEVNRKIVDHVSDINLPYTEHARRYLLNEGLPADQIIKTGSPQKEVLDHHASAIAASDVRVRFGLTKGRYFTVSLHREENVDCPSRLNRLVECLNAVAADHDVPLILSTHPRTQQRLAASGHDLDARIRSLPPLGLIDYVALQRDALCTISDSGTITEEASIIGFPAVTVREVHERPEGMDVGVLLMSGLRPSSLLEAIKVARAHYSGYGPAALPEDYRCADVSWKVAKVIFSYTDFVNRRVWRSGTDR